MIRLCFLILISIYACGGIKSTHSNKQIVRSYWYNENNTDSTLQMEYEIVGNKLHGIVTKFYPNAVLKIKLKYEYNRLISIITVNDTSGMPLNYGYLENGNGCVYQYDDEGRVKAFGCYKNGYRDGEWKYFTYSGDIGSKIHFDEGIAKEHPSTNYMLLD